MRTGYLILITALYLSGIPARGQKDSFDPEIRKCYLNLDTLKGNALLFQRYAPDDPRQIRLIAYRDFLQSLLYQSERTMVQFSHRSDRWLQILGSLKTTNVSVQASRAEIYIYRAVLAGQVSDYRSSAGNLVRAYKIVARWAVDFTSSDRNRLTGILGVLFRQIPDQYEKYLKILGIRSSGLSGLNGLERLYTGSLPESADRMEGYLLLMTALKEFSTDPGAAWEFASDEGLPMLGNPLVRYQSALAALKGGKSAIALDLLAILPEGKMDYAFPYWVYQLGRCCLYLNNPSAIGYLRQYLEKPGGDNYRHVTWLMSAWYYLLNHQPAVAESCLTRIRELEDPLTAYDKQALKEATEDGLPDPDLLRVRLLFDGGFYESCLMEAGSLAMAGIYDDRATGELWYRKGRSEQRLGINQDAISSYLHVLGYGDAIRSYIVPNSALQLGYLYREDGNNDLALRYLRLCIEKNVYGYHDGIERQALIAIRGLEE